MFYGMYDGKDFYQKKGRLGRRFKTPYIKGSGFSAIRKRLKANPRKWIPLD